jgi:bifunctional non-homologous end joining protein LigD
MFHMAIKRPSQLLGYIPPQLATLVDAPPENVGWIHEIKYDGYRTCLVVNGADSRAYTRNGHDWTKQYRAVIEAAGTLNCLNAVIDGEMIVQDETGRSDFHALRAAIDGEPHRLIFYAFDLLVIEGEDLRPIPLVERRDFLEALIGEHDPSWPIQYSGDVSDGPRLLAAAERMGLEGIVSKKANSRYRSGRTTSWLKTKCFAEDEFVVIGAEHEPGSPAFALLARDTGGNLEYAGSAFLTLGSDDRDRFWTAMTLLTRAKPALSMPQKRGRRWVEPKLRVRAQYLKGGDKLRHATIRELIG